jgi:hypothetical protein
VPISGKPEIGAPPPDEVCGFKLHPPDPVGFIESIYSFRSSRHCGVIPAIFAVSRMFS